MPIREAWLLQRPLPPQWTCMWDRTRWKPRSPTLWEQIALRSPGQAGKAGGSQGRRLRIWFGTWGWSSGQYRSPTQEQGIITMLMLRQAEFSMFIRRRSWSYQDTVSSCGCDELKWWLSVWFYWFLAVDAPTLSCRITVCLGLFSARSTL